MASHTELLRRVSIFDGVSKDALEHLSSCLKTVRFEKDTLVVGQDEKGDSLFIIKDGRVKVVLYGESGREVILSIFTAGDIFGEMSLLDGQPRSANVRTMTPTEVLVLSRSDFVEHLHENPDTALKVLSEMCRRMRHADEVIGNLALLDVYGRVGRTLINLGRQDGVETDEGILIRERPTQQDLASMIGTSRETVSRVLSEFQRRGYLAMQGRSILLSYGFAEQLDGTDG